MGEDKGEKTELGAVEATVLKMIMDAHCQQQSSLWKDHTVDRSLRLNQY